MDPNTVVTFPPGSIVNAHTGCFTIECPLPGGLELLLFGGSPPLPTLEIDRPQVRVGQALGGFVRPARQSSEEAQGELERSGILASLPIEWFDAPLPPMRRWFQFRATPGLVDELFRRLQRFASSQGNTSTAMS